MSNYEHEIANNDENKSFGLPDNQETELYELFSLIVDLNQLGFIESVEYFKQGTETFVDFLLTLEHKTDWFDYTQVEDVLFDLDCYVDMLREDESEYYEDED